MAADLEAVRRDAAVERHREADVLRQPNGQRSGTSPRKSIAHAAGEHKAAVKSKDDAARLQVSRGNANCAQTRGPKSDSGASPFRPAEEALIDLLLGSHRGLALGHGWAVGRAREARLQRNQPRAAAPHGRSCRALPTGRRFVSMGRTDYPQ